MNCIIAPSVIKTDNNKADQNEKFFATVQYGLPSEVPRDKDSGQVCCVLMPFKVILL